MASALELKRSRRRARMRARVLFTGYAVSLLAPRLVIMTAVTLGGGLIIQARDPATKDFVDACYAVYTQLFFEHVGPLPKDPVLRLVYFGVPLLGALVLAEGLFKLGASLLDFQNHREQWKRVMARAEENHIILVGLGHVGARVLEELTSRDRPVVVIEAHEAGAVEEARAAGVPVIVGDARRESLLVEAGVERAAAIIACTDDDLVNLEVTLDARKKNETIRVVLRMFDRNMADKIGNAFAVDSTFSTSALAAPVFAAAALDERVHGAYRLGDTLMLSVEIAVQDAPRLDKMTLSDVETALEAPVVGVVRAGAAPTPRFARTETLGPHDAVVVHIPSDTVEELRDRARGSD